MRLFLEHLRMSRIEAEAEIVKAAKRDTFECWICTSPRNRGLAVQYYFNTGRAVLVCLECASSIERMRHEKILKTSLK